MKHASSSGSHTTGVGQKILQVHDHSQCRGRNCVIHHPSDHALVHLPTVWTDRGMTRLCPHGQLHEDPDSVEYRNRHHYGSDQGNPAHGWLRPDSHGQYIVESYWTPSLDSGIVCDGCCDKRHPPETMVSYVRMEMMI